MRKTVIFAVVLAIISAGTAYFVYMRDEPVPAPVLLGITIK